MTVKTGDVFVASWGYDQTNINYEQVVGVTASGKSVYVKPIHFKAADDGRKVVADVGNFKTAYTQTLEDGEVVNTEKDTTTRRVIRTTDRNVKVFDEAAGYYRDETVQDVSYRWTSFADAYRVDPTIPQYDTIAAGEPGH